MRGAGFVVLLFFVGCQTVPETTGFLEGHDTASSVSSLFSDVKVLASHSDIVPTDFSIPSENDDSSDGDHTSLSGDSRPTLQVKSASQDESVDSAMLASLTLKAAIQTALKRNPDLLAIRSGEPVAHAAYHVAKTYPFNPQFQTQVLPYTRDRSGNDAPVSQQHVIVQTFELAGQSRFRTEAAAANWEQVRHTIQQAELLTIAQVERLYFTTLYQWELRETNQLLTRLNAKMVGVIERRFKAGQANSADVALARLQAQSARRRQRLVEANYQTALMNLRNYLNLAEDSVVDLNNHWLDWRWSPVADVVLNTPLKFWEDQTPDLTIDEGDGAFRATLQQMVADRPDVAAANANVTMARENLALADAMRTPNLQIGPMWQRDDAATQFWGVQAQIDIPVVNTGIPLVRQRSAQLQQQQVTAARLEERAMLEARAAIRRYERARRLVEQSRSDFAKSMPDVLKPFEDQFRAGQITLLQVFAGRTSFAQSRQSFLDLLNELSLAAADVTQATGLPVWQLIHDVPPPSRRTKNLQRP